MAACSFGASSLKLFNLNLVPSATKPATLQSPRIQTLIRCDGLSLSQRADKSFFRCRCLPVAKSHLSLENNDEEAKPSGTTSPLIPNSFEVESLLTQICDTTSIAEFELKLGGFRLYVTRELAGKYETSTLPVSAPALSTPVATTEEPVLDGSTSSASLAISRPVLVGLQSFFDKSAEEGLVILHSPRVGYFKRSRTIKGKRAAPSCKERQEVNEGQVLCFIEQLGGEIPIESDTSGEVIKILREDGDPVGYGDALIAILPSFPGIKKLQ